MLCVHSDIIGLLRNNQSIMNPCKSRHGWDFYAKEDQRKKEVNRLYKLIVVLAVTIVSGVAFVMFVQYL